MTRQGMGGMNPTTTVRIEKTDGIGIVTLDKPPVNAIDLKLVQDADRSVRGLLEDDGIGAVVSEDKRLEST